MKSEKLGTYHFAVSPRAEAPDYHLEALLGLKSNLEEAFITCPGRLRLGGSKASPGEWGGHESCDENHAGLMREFTFGWGGVFSIL